MKSIRYILALSLLTLISGCITQFVPETDENDTMLVVEGMLTDQEGVHTVKLSKSLPLSADHSTEVLSGATVNITDNFNNWYTLDEIMPGTYVTPPGFKGIVGRKYKIQIYSNNPDMMYYTYESLFMEMKPVPPIDTVFYDKIDTKLSPEGNVMEQECQIYFNTYDPTAQCKYFRWDFTETWMFRLPYDVPNRECWMTNSSSSIFIKNATVLSETVINKYPLLYITSRTDRLSERYSLLVNQYSLNEDEFNYWEKMQNVTENVGSLYDMTPMSIQGNIYCVEDPRQQVLGYFSVSAIASKRIYIDESFKGLINLYKTCPTDTVFGRGPDPEGYGVSKWLIIDNSRDMANPYKVYTVFEGCADCTIRGTNVRPYFWEDREY